MTREELYEELSRVTALREHRLKQANMVLDDMDLFPMLIDILFKVDDAVSCRAAWVFEFVCSASIEVIVPHLDTFTDNIHRVHLDSAVRPIAKVCELMVKSYYAREDHPIKDHLTAVHKEKIIEACFDWLINDEKVAPKAYSMQTLFLLGKDYGWIHPELEQILSGDFHKESAGFKARARHILRLIKTA
jgi:hypothetical protein